MEWHSYKIEIITPCFCAGADQQKAEIRAPSIRGQLRWWFRALGGRREDEKAVFGGVHNHDVRASAIDVRVQNIVRGTDWQSFSMKLGDSGAYIWYFAGVANQKKRWWKNGSVGMPNYAGCLPPGSTFDLRVGFRKQIGSQLEAKFYLAFEAFCRFGGIGMRLTRGMGALSCANYDGNLSDYKRAANDILTSSKFCVRWRDISFPSWDAAIFDAEKWLKNDLRRTFNARRCTNSPLGCDRPRQTSAIYFRPIKCGNQYHLMIFEAPHRRVLSQQSCRHFPEPILQQKTFVGNAPLGNVRQ